VGQGTITITNHSYYLITEFFIIALSYHNIKWYIQRANTIYQKQSSDVFQ